MEGRGRSPLLPLPSAETQRGNRGCPNALRAHSDDARHTRCLYCADNRARADATPWSTHCTSQDSNEICPLDRDHPLRIRLGARGPRLHQGPPPRRRALSRLVELRVRRRGRQHQRSRSARRVAPQGVPGRDQELERRDLGRPEHLAPRCRRQGAPRRQPAPAGEPEGEEADRPAEGAEGARQTTQTLRRSRGLPVSRRGPVPARRPRSYGGVSLRGARAEQSSDHPRPPRRQRGVRPAPTAAADRSIALRGLRPRHGTGGNSSLAAPTPRRRLRSSQPSARDGHVPGLGGRARLGVRIEAAGAHLPPLAGRVRGRAERAAPGGGAGVPVARRHRPRRHPARGVAHERGAGSGPDLRARPRRRAPGPLPRTSRRRRPRSRRAPGPAAPVGGDAEVRARAPSPPPCPEPAQGPGDRAGLRSTQAEDLRLADRRARRWRWFRAHRNTGQRSACRARPHRRRRGRRLPCAGNGPGRNHPGEARHLLPRRRRI